MFVLLPIIEIVLLVVVGQQIGVWATLGILLVEALIGGWLVRREGRRAWRALTEGIHSGSVPAGGLTDPALVLLGGVLLIVPGYLTDLFALALVLPWTRPYARRALAWLLDRHLRRRLGVGTDVLRAHLDPTNTIPGGVADTPPTGTMGDQPQDPGHLVIRGEISERSGPDAR